MSALTKAQVRRIYEACQPNLGFTKVAWHSLRPARQDEIHDSIEAILAPHPDQVKSLRGEDDQPPAQEQW